jgi:4'-phosphopantetheinyl transferase
MLNAPWSDPTQWPELRAGEVQVWLAELTAARAQSGDFAAVLSPEEQERAGRFRSTLHRERWVSSRGILRMALARCLGVTPSRIEFDYNVSGKPALRTPAAPGFHFNLSHSGDYAAFAFTRVGAVGVDIESVRAGMPQMEDIARRYFAPGESAALLALPTAERDRAFFQLWTCKEAFVKARGTGLFSGLNRFEVEVQSSRLLTLDGVPARGWWMAALPEFPAIAGGLVVAAATCSPSFLRWSERFCT